jgi:hypothetical protein
MRMHHAEVLIPKADASCQLAVEKKWLCGKTPGSMLARQANSPSEWQDIAKRILGVLAHPKLRKTLEVLATHNQAAEAAAAASHRWPQRRVIRSTPVLLGPCLFNIIHSLEARDDVLQKMPALGRTTDYVKKLDKRDRRSAASSKGRNS